jgi:peptidyl-prolyl cis-trans isomerase C
MTDFNERITNLPPKYQKVVNNRKEEFLSEIINDTLLYREALKDNIHKDKEVKKLIEEARKKILIARLLKDKVDDEIVITDEDIEIFYEANRNLYMSPEIMRVSHILVPTSEEAETILKAIKEGSSFEDMARAKSVDPTAQRGGDIGYFPKGQLMPEFENACAELDIGETSGVVKTALGYHIIRLTDRKPPKLRPIEDVSEDIKARLHNIKRQELFGKLLKRLRSETEIHINNDLLVDSGNKKDPDKGS